MFGSTRKDAHDVACWTVPLAVPVTDSGSQCDTKLEEDGQQTGTTMVYATFTKHLVTVLGNIMISTKWKRLADQPRASLQL